MSGPSLVLADEPTGALDAVASRALGELLCQVVRQLGTTMLIATHDEALAATADRVVRLDGGRVAEADLGEAVT